MGKLQSNFDFRLMSLVLRLRDLRLPRMEIMREVGIQTGSWVLDFGCGPGSYVPAVSELVGPSGKVYALDIHPLAKEAHSLYNSMGFEAQAHCFRLYF